MTPEFRIVVNGNGEYRIERLVFRYTSGLPDEIWEPIVHAGDGCANLYVNLSTARTGLDKVRKSSTWTPVEETE